MFVHRDFMPRNLMATEPLPGVLDFQDALYGPVSYDIASLMRDAFLSWGNLLSWISQFAIGKRPVMRGWPYRMISGSSGAMLSGWECNGI